MEFLENSVAVGEIIPLRVEIVHPPDIAIVFPDTAIDFGKFEVHHSTFQLTATENGVSRDEKTYYIQTFEIDSVQRLTLPCRHVLGKDTVLTFIEADSFTLRHQVEKIPSSPDSLKKAIVFEEGLEEYELPADYSRAMITIGIFLASILLLALMLWRPVRKQIKLWRIKKEWKRLCAEWEEMESTVNQPVIFANRLNAAWKKYLDRDWKIPFLSLTSPEIENALSGIPDFSESQQKILTEASRSSDAIIYGGIQVSKETLESFLNGIYPILEESYHRKRKAWKA